MSLLSLRKHNLQSQTVKRLRHKTRQVNAEQFIDEAINYANGQNDNVIAFQSAKRDTQAQKLTNQAQESDLFNTQVSNAQAASDKTPFRRATFTLSEPCIETLNKYAKQQNCAKSHLIRMLIRHFDELTPEDQQVILAQQKD